MSTTTTQINQAPNLLSEFQSVEAADTPRYINILVYGPSGAGKTVFGATGPGPVLYLDLDDGLASVRRPRPELVSELGMTIGQIYEKRIKNYTELKAALATLQRVKRAGGAFPKTLVFDNLTVAQAICMQARTSGDESISVDKLPERQDWGVLLQNMRSIVRFVRDLPCHTVFICMEQEKDGFIGPALQGAMFREIPAMVDFVARYVMMVKEVDDGKGGKVEKEARFLQCHASAAIPGKTLAVVGKNRGGWLAKFEKPVLRDLIEKVYPSTPTSSP